MTERLAVGRIAGAHGIRGECVVEVLSDAPERFEAGSVLDADEGTLTVTKARPHKGRLLVMFEEVPDRTEAERLRGTLLTIAAGDAVALPEGLYYPHALHGMDVRDEQGAALGALHDVLETPAHDIWVVRTSDGRDVMVPVVDEFVRSVDTDRRIIVLAPIGGMFD